MNGMERDYYQIYQNLIRSQLEEEQRRQQRELQQRMSELAPWGGSARIPTAEISRQYATGLQRALSQLALAQTRRHWESAEREKRRSFEAQQLSRQLEAQREMAKLQEQLREQFYESQRPSGGELALKFLAQALGIGVGAATGGAGMALGAGLGAGLAKGWG